MQLRNTDQKYGWVSIILHWSMALFILFLFALGIYMVELDYYDPWYHKAPDLHKSIGCIVILLLTARILWRNISVKPHIFGSQWEQRAALIVHRSHYILMLLVVFSGYLIPTANGEGINVFDILVLPSMGTLIDNQEDIAGAAHWFTAWIMMFLIALHICAALKHHLLDKDPTLLRILGIRHKEL